MTTLSPHSPTASEEVERIAATFLRDGYAPIPELLSPEELAALREDTAQMIANPLPEARSEEYMYHDLPTGRVMHRIQYVFSKSSNGACLALLAHPRVLAIVERLLGDDFVCEAEALVFKSPENTKQVPIHADGDPMMPGMADLIFNVDVYLDDATEENGCLWAAPGTQNDGRTGAEITAIGWDYPGLRPVPAKAGDALLHNIKVVHGSSDAKTPQLRRTLYYEFQSYADLVRQNGPRPGVDMRNDWLNKRLALVRRAIAERGTKPYAQGETPFDYRGPETTGRRERPVGGARLQRVHLSRFAPH